MVVLHLSLGSLDIVLHVSFRKISIRSKQYVLVALQYEEVSNYSVLIKCNFTL